MARRDRYSEETLEQIAKCKNRKNVRRKARKARNKRLREQNA
jgi:hypothetical protein